MQALSLIKRLLLYVLLIGISLVGLLVVVFSGGREYGTNYLLICMYLIPQYIFGLYFLNEKLIFKLIVPFVTSIVSFGSFWLIGQAGLFDIINFDILFYFVWFFPIVAAWEIAYQILKCKN